MKKILAALAFGLVTVYLVYNALDTDIKSVTSDDLSSLSWETQKHAQYQLIRPLEFTKGTEDIWGLPVRENQWYAVNTERDGSLILNDVSGGTSPTLIDNIVVWKKIGVLDTVVVGFSDTDFSSVGQGKVQKFVAVCLKQGFELRPVLDQHNNISLIAGAEEES